MNFDILKFEPKVIKNFFSNEESKMIVDFINNKIQYNLDNNKNKYYDFEINKYLGCFMYLDSNDQKTFSKEIRNFITKKIEEYLNITTKNVYISWHRYSTLSETNPYVGAHVDKVADYHIMSASIPLNNDFLWDFIVNGKRYELNNNDAIFFCVSDDLHSRPLRTFKENEFYDSLIIRFMVEGSRVPVTESKHLNREQKAKEYRKLETN